MKVSKIIFRLLYFLNILKTLIILNDLMMFVEDAPETDSFCSIIIPAKEITETIKSNMFQLSLKYVLPKPSNFMIASKMNNIENT
jgi:hypothetical protein